ncbi:MAG: RNA methyltransferase substrate-binding domain-containing protein, partial [Gammaproteobacteria bacterium]|nr:RNA methyltransferase substrate-binding domain-containing protein [Gammaproteobacteria bacterium]
MPEHRIIYGFHAIKSQLKVSPVDIVAVYCTKTRHDPRFEDILALLVAENIPIYYYPLERLNNL